MMSDMSWLISAWKANVSTSAAMIDSGLGCELKVCSHHRERTRVVTGYRERSEKVTREGGSNGERADVTVHTPVPCARARAGAELASEWCALGSCALACLGT
jgi:hypothetical protein